MNTLQHIWMVHFLAFVDTKYEALKMIASLLTACILSKSHSLT